MPPAPTEMNDRSTTATVETLAATVQVLMVGRRQITLSVAKQLDRVERYEIEPMGRVRLGGGVQELIGRHRPTGTLVTSRLRHHLDVYALWIDVSTLPRRIGVCRKAASRWDDFWCLNTERIGGRAFFVSADDVDECKHESLRPCYCSREWFGPRSDVEVLLDERDVARGPDLAAAGVRADEALPLIVLAGLR